MKSLIIGGELIRHADADPSAEAALLVEDGVIVAVGSDAERGADGDTLVQRWPDHVIAPGLIDSHVHLVWKGDGGDALGRNPLYAAIGRSPAELAAQVIANMQAALASGVTTVRDCGGTAEVIIPVARAVDSGLLVGPRIVTAGAPITSTGGHCWFLQNEAEGAEQLRRAVRRMHKAGADFIKVMVTGGGSTAGSNPRASQYRQDELDAIVEDAHRLELAVSGHVHGTEGIERAVIAGFDTLEHCTWLHRNEDGEEDYRPDVVAQIRDRGIYVCKTMAGFERWPLEELEVAGSRHAGWAKFDTFRRMVDERVRIIAGTDAGITDTDFIGLHRTMETMVGLGGMDHRAVFRSATSTAASALGVGDRVGTLEVGKRADCIVLDANPLDDIRALRSVRAVVRDGMVVAERGFVRVDAGSATMQ